MRNLQLMLDLVSLANRRVTALFVVAVMAVVVATAARADDQIRTRPSGNARGSISLMTSTTVSIDMVGGQKKEIPVNEIEAIVYDGEPPDLKLVRSETDNENYQGALARLDKIDMAKVTRAEIKQDIAFYRAYCLAQMALEGSGDIRKAGSGVWTFVRENPSNYHYLTAVELLGDLFLSNGSYDQALEQYAILESTAPWLDIKARAGVAKGHVLILKKMFPEALTVFDAVLKEIGDDQSGTLASEKLAAQLGKANCLAATGESATAIGLVQTVIENADAEDVDLNARAYLTLGNCYRMKKETTTDALLAYLHVDLLYAKSRQAHAEALWNLARIWNELGKPERALQASQLLKDRYAGSVWERQ